MEMLRDNVKIKRTVLEKSETLKKKAVGNRISLTLY